MMVSVINLMKMRRDSHMNLNERKVKERKEYCLVNQTHHMMKLSSLGLDTYLKAKATSLVTVMMEV